MPDRFLRRVGFRTFRFRLLVAMALLVSAITLGALYYTQRKVEAETAQHLDDVFQSALAALDHSNEVRLGALSERCRVLVTKPRIHAALEDNALDLLYPSARDELRDLIQPEEDAPASSRRVLRARFYRFLDAYGGLIAGADDGDAGELPPEVERALTLRILPEGQHIGYFIYADSVAEIIATPIYSSESGEAIAALVLGFRPSELEGVSTPVGMKSGIWTEGGLYFPSISDRARAEWSALLKAETARKGKGSFIAEIDGAPQRMFFRQLNPDSLYPPAYEVCTFPLGELLQRQHQLRWRAIGVFSTLLVLGIVGSHFLAVRFSAPVERLQVVSQENIAQREIAEAALEQTSEELLRAARFSADTSHQLKTPVAVLRAGLEGLRDYENLTEEQREEIDALVHQTFRLTGIIEDLLLLSRMDAGRLRLNFERVNLNRLIEAWLDDLSAIPEGPDVEVDIDIPEDFEIAGERRYTTLIIENLLVNARKYNRPGGEIAIQGEEEGEYAVLSIANTGASIPRNAQEHIFERFHRGAMGENVPGHGLGLNLARELAVLHHGELRLVQSDDDWTVFEVRFLLASALTEK